MTLAVIGAMASASISVAALKSLGGDKEAGATSTVAVAPSESEPASTALRPLAATSSPGTTAPHQPTNTNAVLTTPQTSTSVAVSRPTAAPAPTAAPVPKPAPAPKPTPVPTPTQPPAPALTPSQQNAIKSAQSYLRFTNFSRLGLIDQLVFEQFSADDATFAVDSLPVDYNAQAAGSAQSYLKFTSFSCQGLIDQLVFEKYTVGQATYGATQVGLC